MKKSIRITALLLSIVLLVGCSKSAKKVNTQMNSTERAISKEIRKIYAEVNESNMIHYLFNVNDEFCDTLLTEFKPIMHGATLKEFTLKEVYEFDEFSAYAVVAYYSGGAKDMLINDLVLIGEVEDAYYIILQQMYSQEAQQEIVDVAVSLKDVCQGIFNACNKKYGSFKPVTTPFSIKDTTSFIYNEEGKIIPSGCGLVYDFALTLEDIGRGETAAPENLDENVEINENYLSDIDTAPQTLQDGRELVWHLEFTGNNINDLSSALNTGLVTMAPDRKNLFTSTSSENYFLDSGNLVLRITKDPTKNIYTTAKSLTTSGRMSYKYGYVEMRAIVPYMRSVWPSFWMQPDKQIKESKLYNGEIDIFEVFGSANTATFNLHKWYNGYKGSDTIGERGNYTGSLNYRFVDRYNLNKEYHVYGFEWTSDYMKVYIDGECYYEVSIKEEDDYSTEHPGMDCFHDYYYLCWNNWLFENEVADGSLKTPVDYKIDYVRLYQYPNKEFIKLY